MESCAVDTNCRGRACGTRTGYCGEHGVREQREGRSRTVFYGTGTVYWLEQG